MARTHIVNENRTDASEHFNLGALFGGVMSTSEGHTLEGKPANSTTLDSFSRVKLAGNARVHNGTTIHDFYAFGGHDASQHSRREFEGPILPGPYLYGFTLGVAITAHDEPDDLALLIRDGDTVEFLGTKYRVQLSSRRESSPKFLPID